MNSHGEEKLPFIKTTERGITLSIIVSPRSASNSIVGVTDGRLKIKLTSPPVDGKANQALINYLSKLLKVSKSSIEILKGKTSKKKLVLIEDISEAEIIEVISK